MDCAGNDVLPHAIHRTHLLFSPHKSCPSPSSLRASYISSPLAFAICSSSMHVGTLAATALRHTPPPTHHGIPTSTLHIPANGPCKPIPLKGAPPPQQLPPPPNPLPPMHPLQPPHSPRITPPEYLIVLSCPHALHASRYLSRGFQVFKHE